MVFTEIIANISKITGIIKGITEYGTPKVQKNDTAIDAKYTNL